MKKLFFIAATVLVLASCGDNGNTGNPTADEPALDDQGAAIKSGDPNATKVRNHDTVTAGRDSSFYPK